jgi:hypothetical protein
MAARQLCVSDLIALALATNSYAGYMLLGLISSFVFRAVRDALRGQPAAQEQILGASFAALAIADVSAVSLKRCSSHLIFLRLLSEPDP